MFNIEKMIMYSLSGEEYIYEFSRGINYFKGVNNSGKTEFYNFIDYIFGSSADIRKKPWYKDSLESVKLIFEFNNIKYEVSRNRDPEINFLNYYNEEYKEQIDLREYKERLNSIFTKGNIEVLKEIKEFTNEMFTYRTFTMFNFLGEKRQGLTYDFFDKCSDIKYSTKLNPLLNYIFNKNLERIGILQEELKTLILQIKKLEDSDAEYAYITKQINLNLKKLDYNKEFKGSNKQEIKSFILELKNMNLQNRKRDDNNISDLEVAYNNLTEKIKVYENRDVDIKQIKKENENRKYLLENLNQLVNENEEFMYLVTPIEKLVKELDTSISFSKYIISDETINRLKKQKEVLKKEIVSNKSRFKMYSVEDKIKFIALIEEYLSSDLESVEEELKSKKKRVKEIKDELKVLQNLDDVKKIKSLSDYMTTLYKSAGENSKVVADDIKKEKFTLSYIKKGNVIQPTYLKENNLGEKGIANYYVGSMARHTLIQLCGYLGFLKMLLEDNKYPLIPMLIIDHISKPFSSDNSMAIGKIINTAYESIGKANLQIFIFDDEDHENLLLNPDHSENLVDNNKTGFNPFYFTVKDE
ncbi:hypothetical protein J1907_08125 [Lysinibacillus sphaericus]|uniref:hypothetical protein n=1 Tax=Lysinibacillus sphaericus TaxID=1421 RepID=UPI001A9D6816|nr:hypothetical protein [Lysinibacillus sphaericus]QTB24008.1 hypothetical protein J1907_08125 [Lysinibacillus sphaericus]